MLKTYADSSGNTLSFKFCLHISISSKRKETDEDNIADYYDHNINLKAISGSKSLIAKLFQLSHSSLL